MQVQNACTCILFLFTFICILYSLVVTSSFYQAQRFHAWRNKWDYVTRACFKTMYPCEHSLEYL